MYQEDEIFLDLKDMCLRLLLKWRMICVVGIVSAILGIGVGAFLNNSQYKADLEHAEAQKIALSGGETDFFEPYVEKMTDLEIEQFTNKIGEYKEYQKQYEEAKEYYDTSLYMDMDPDAVLTKRVQYYIDKKTELSSYAEYNMLSDLASSIVSNVVHGADYGKMAELTGKELDPTYWRELYSISNDGPFIYVNVTAPDDSVADALLQIVDEAIIAYTKNLNDYDDCKVSMVEEISYVQKNTSVANIQQSALSSVNSYRETMESLPKVLNENQKLLYEALTEDLFIERDLLSISSAIIGGFLGGVLICGYIILQYILGATLHTEDEMSSIYRTQLLGEGYIAAKKPAFLPGIDAWLIKLLVGETSKTAADARERAEADIRVMMKQKGWKKLYITSTTEDTACMTLARDLKNALANADFETKLDCRVPQDAESLTEIAAADCVVMVERTDVSRKDAIKKEVALCERYNTNVLGAVVLREI